MSAFTRDENKLISGPLKESILLTEKISDLAVDTQVKIKKNKIRRTYTLSYKLQILSAFDACGTASERGALLRKEGLYHSRIHAWKIQLADSIHKNPKKSSNSELRVDHLTRENEQLKKKLAQAEAILDLQKKVSELLGTHILPHKDSEEKS
jgi:hypothetical protein